MGVKTRSAKRLSDSGGTAPQYACRGWIRLDMTQANTPVTAGRNVGAVFDIGVGNWQVQWQATVGDSTSDGLTSCAQVSVGRNAPAAVSEAINFQIASGVGGATTPQPLPGNTTTVFASQANAAVDLGDVSVCVFR